MSLGRVSTAQALAARLADHERRCFVYENPPPESGFFLLLCDDDGGRVLVDRAIDFEAALWLCGLVNAALGGERAKRGVRP